MACPGCGEDRWGKWVKRKMAVCGMEMGLVDWGLAVGCLREFWRVGRWIRREGMKKEVFEPCSDDFRTLEGCAVPYDYFERHREH